MELIMALAAICQLSFMPATKEILENTVSYQKSCQVHLSKCILDKRRADEKAKRRRKHSQEYLLECLANADLKKI